MLIKYFMLEMKNSENIVTATANMVVNAAIHTYSSSISINEKA